jgi:hypothetical protein
MIAVMNIVALNLLYYIAYPPLLAGKMLDRKEKFPNQYSCVTS